MNKIISICLLFVLFLSSCGSSGEGEVSRIKKSVESVETILGRYDNNVQSAIDSRNFEYIPVVTQEALDSTNIVLDKLKIMGETASNKDLVNAAVTYTESLRELILVEEKYSKLSDVLSEKEAKKIDESFLQHSQKAQEAYSEYSSLLENLSTQ